MAVTALAPLKVRRDHEVHATEGGWFRANDISELLFVDTPL